VRSIKPVEFHGSFALILFPYSLDSLAFAAGAKQLQPVVRDMISAGLSDFVHQWLQPVAAKELGTAALLADQQVIVIAGSGDISMAILGLVDSFDQGQFFEAGQSTVNGYQA
jgi:hypothetical protein